MSTRTTVVAAIVLATLWWLCLPAAFGQPPASKPAPGAGAQVGAKPPGEVNRIKVVADKAPDCSTLGSIAASVTRDCQTNDEKAVALYNFLQLALYHLQYPSEPGGIEALKLINVYGWSLCGGLHTVEAALWREMGWQWRYVGWSQPGHTTVEAQYDGKWHYLDVFLKIYLWRPDASAPGGRTIASQDDIKANPDLVGGGLVLDADRKVYYFSDNRFEIIGNKANWQAPALLVCGDEPEGVITGVNHKSQAGSGTGWMGIKFDGDYSTDVGLAPGYSLTLTWDAVEGGHWFSGRKTVPRHSCGDKDYRNYPGLGNVLEPYWSPQNRARTFASGQLVFAPDFSSQEMLKSLAGAENVRWQDGKLVPADPARPAAITVLLQSPYVMTRATGQADRADKAEISLDGGKTFKPIELKDFSDAVGGQYRCLVRIALKEPLASLRLEVLLQCNRCALPYLSPGKNLVTVSTADPRELGDGKLVVTYAYRLGSRNRSFEEMAERSAEIARAHYAAWSETPNVVQKAFSARDLPATFEIDVPTPRDKYPVYPRMLLLRREVLSPSARPAPLPQGAVEMKVGPDDELKVLPNPFLVGVAKPPKRVVRPTTTRQIPLESFGAVSLDGQTAPNHFLKWKEKETWVLLVGGQLGDLPRPADIAAARLVFPVVRGHKEAATRVAAVLLKAPAEKGRAYDFANLSDPAGSVNVPKQPGEGDYSPPQEFKIDLTRAIKSVAAGEGKFHGLAIRTVPDRGVDDGWIVRVDVPDSPKIRLELDVYAPTSTAPGAR
jgi:hypothetical protein